MIPLRCTVRGCALPLTLVGATLGCGRGHAFDRGREGYWNLLQPQDRRSERAGDNAAAVAARRRWLARGVAEPFARVLSTAIDALSLATGDLVVDVGCGEGTLTARLVERRGLRVCGVDLAVSAIRLAARQYPGSTWVVANADRGIPLEDGSAALALSLFGRRPPAELARVVRSGGHLVAAVPGEDDLVELREETQGRAERRDRAEGVAREMAPSFEVVSRLSWRGHAMHDRAALADAAAMTYRGARRAERDRLDRIESMEVTLSAEILVMRRVSLDA